MSTTRELVKPYVVIERRIWAEVKEISTLVKEDASRIAALGIRLVLAILKAKRVPDDLGEVLLEKDPEALEMLQSLVKRLG